MAPSPDPITAYHEAGHAVVALYHERPVDRVSVLPRREYLGICKFQKGVFRPSKDWLENEILIALAGPAAEARYTGEYDWNGGSRDLAVAGKLAEMRAGESQADRLLTRLLAKVENLLADEQLWQAVEAIVRALLVNGEISGRAARHHYDEACREE